MTASLIALLASATGIAFVHTFAPDHWMPFAALARGQGWSRRRLVGVTLTAGLGHVGSSVLIGVIGITLGWALELIQWMQGSRGQLSLWMLVFFGFGYAGWGLWRARGWRHAHVHAGELHTHEHGHDAHRHRDAVRGVSSWSLFVIFVLGPCEALVPLMFAAVPMGPMAVLGTSLAFSAATVATMTALALLAAAGFSLVRSEAFERHLQFLTGTAIGATALLVLVLDI